MAAGQARIAELDAELGTARAEHKSLTDQLKAALAAIAAAGGSTLANP